MGTRMGKERPCALSETDVYAQLAPGRRRLLLRILSDLPTPLTAIEVAELIAQCEGEDSAGHRDVYDSLVEEHLPQLERVHVVVYDRDSGTVRPGPNFASLLELLENGVCE